MSNASTLIIICQGHKPVKWRDWVTVLHYAVTWKCLSLNLEFLIHCDEKQEMKNLNVSEVVITAINAIKLDVRASVGGLKLLPKERLNCVKWSNYRFEIWREIKQEIYSSDACQLT